MADYDLYDSDGNYVGTARESSYDSSSDNSMADYDLYDSDGNYVGTARGSSYGSSSGNGAGGLLTMIIVYALCIIGGIIMLTNVAEQAPICIVPAVLGFIALLIPIIIATGTGNFFIKLLHYLYVWSDVVIGLLISMFWIVYVNDLASTTVLSVMAFGLMYLTAVSGIRIYKRMGGAGLGAAIGIAVITYLIVLTAADDFEIGNLALIPTIVAMFSVLVGSIVDFSRSENVGTTIASIVKFAIFVAIIVVIVCMFPSTSNSKQEKLQNANDLIAQGDYAQAREILQDLKMDEAQELYKSIRYRHLQVGEIIYNGSYSSDPRCASEKGIAYICVEVDATTDKALLVCLDVIGLGDNSDGCISEDYIKTFYTYTDDIQTSPVGKSFSKFFLFSYEQYEKYVANESLKDYLMHPNLSKNLKKEKESINDGTKYNWAHTDYWLLNSFHGNDIGTINVETGEFEWKTNINNYAGIRPCYWAYIGDVVEEP